MENNKENDMVPTLKIGSGLGSGPKALSRNQIFTKNLVLRRNELQYTQQKLSDMTGIKLRTIQNYENGYRPKGDNIITLAEVLECSLDWLLLGKGPEPDPPGGKKQIDIPSTLYNKVEPEIIHVAAPGVEYGAGINLKDELIYSQKKIITHLEKENSNLKASLEAIKKRLSQITEDENIEKKVM